MLADWQTSGYQPGPGWGGTAPRLWQSTPQPKSTLPISFSPGVKPVLMEQLSPGHWFVDFGTEMMAGLTLKVTGGKAGAKITVRLSEELLCSGCSAKGCNTCDANTTTKAILYPMRTGNTYAETWTLADGTSEIENHEYKYS